MKSTYLLLIFFELEKKREKEKKERKQFLFFFSFFSFDFFFERNKVFFGRMVKGLTALFEKIRFFENLLGPAF